MLTRGNAEKFGDRRVLAFFARACPELVEGVGGDAAGATLVRSTPPLVYVVVVPALRKVREGRGTNSCGGFCSLKAGLPAHKDGVPGLFELYFLGRDSGGTRPARR